MKKWVDIILGGVSMVLMALILGSMIFACVALVWEAWDAPVDFGKHEAEWEARDELPEGMMEEMRMKLLLLEPGEEVATNSKALPPGHE